MFTAVELPAGAGPAHADNPGDLNGDGLPDIAMPWTGEDRMAVYYRNPNATAVEDVFFGPVVFETFSSPISTTTVDVDGDGRNDVVLSSRNNALNVFLQR